MKTYFLSLSHKKYGYVTFKQISFKKKDQNVYVQYQKSQTNNYGNFFMLLPNESAFSTESRPCFYRIIERTKPLRRRKKKQFEISFI